MKVKLIFIFILAVGAVSLVGYISHLGLSGLMRTLQQTVQPDSREQDVESLLYHISESENSVRIFTILKESKYLGSYQSSIEKSKATLTKLKEISEQDTYAVGQLDSVELLLKQKISTQQRLINLSRERRKIDVYEEVLTEFISLSERDEIVDSLREVFLRAELLLEKEIAAKEALLSDKKNALDEEEKSGLFRNLFGESKRRREQKEDQNQEIQRYAEVLDTLFAAKDTLGHVYDTLHDENITKEIQSALSDIKEREQQIISDLAKIEVGLTKEDHMIGLEIQKHTQHLQRYFEQADITEAELAGSFFDKISNRLTIVGSVFSMLFIVMLFVVLNDLQVRERNRKELEVAKEKAEKLARAKDEFLSSVSHEIRTPLNAIMGFVEQLNDSELKDYQRKYVGIVKNATNHLLAIINDLLDYAKIEAGKIRPEYVPFSAEEQANLVYNTLHKKATDKKLNLETHFSENIKRQIVIGDPVRFRQIIFNLLDNAIKFTETGSVRLFIDYENSHVLIRVTDSGIGIPEKNLDSIFNKFDQATEGSKNKYGGIGLGLSIVKNLTELQNGTISVHSTENKGSEFTVLLPYKIAESEAKEIANQSFSPDNKFDKNISVLIVDDEAYNRILLETVLDKYKIINSSVSSGEEAIELNRHQKFDAILMDLQMNPMDGFETAAIILKEPKSKLPIIAVTASADHAIISKCRAAGFADVLLKPVAEKDLIDCLQKHLALQNKNSSDFPDENPSVPLAGNSFTDPFQNDGAASMKMAAIYLESLKNAKKDFEYAIENKDLNKASKTAHKIIPSSRHMGFDQFALKLKEFETGFEEGNGQHLLVTQLTDILKITQEIMESVESFVNTSESKN